MKRVLKVAAALLVLGAVVFGAGVWRLRQAPLDLNWLRPYMIDALQAARPGLAVNIDAMQVVWAGRHIELRALGVRVVHSETGHGLALPTIALRPRLRALIRGRLELNRVTLIGLHLDLVHTSAGVMLPGSITTQTAGSAEDLPARLAAVRDLLDVVGSVDLSDGEIRVHDESGKEAWRVTAVRGTLAPKENGVTARVAAEIGAAAAPFTVAATFAARDAGTVHAQFAIEQTVLPAIWRAVPDELRATAPPRLETIVTAVTSAVDAIFDVDIAPDGSIAAPMRMTIHSEPLAIAGERHASVSGSSLHLIAHVDANGATFTIDEGRVVLSGSTITLRGTLAGSDRQRTLDATVAIDRLPITTLRDYWPSTIAPSARRWVVENITAGGARNVTLTAHVPFGGTPDSRLELKGSYDGVAVRFAPDMPPATGVRGEISGSAERVVFTVKEGKLDELDVRNGTVTITPANSDTPLRVSVAADAAGALAPAMRVLSHDPINLDRVSPVAADDVDGSLLAHIECTIPIGGGTDATPTFVGNGHVSDVAVRRAVNGWMLSNGDANLKLDGGTLAAEGRVLVNDVPVDLSLRQQLTRSSSAQVHLKADLDDAARERLGIVVGNSVRGVMRVRGDASRQVEGGWLVDVDADLTEVALTSAVAALTKYSGTPGHGRAHVLIASPDEVRVDGCDIDAGRFAVTGTAERSGLQWRRIRAQLQLRRPPKEQDPSPPSADAPAKATAMVDITADRTGDDTAVALQSADAGAVLALIAGVDTEGGRLSFNGAVKTSNAMHGTLRIDDIHVLHAPILAKVLTLGSLSGLTGLVLREGVRFKLVRSELRYDGQIVHMSDSRAEADAMTILGKGTIDPTQRQLDLRASLVPSYYGLNTAPQKIPVLGKLIEKATGEGLQVIDARVRGNFDDPKVTLEPASIFAPEVIKEELRALGQKSRARR